MKKTLRSLVLVVVAGFVAMVAVKPVYATPVPLPDNIISIDNGLFVIDEYSNSQYVVHNYSSSWYIYAFAVSNQNALNDNPLANYNSWVATSANLGLGNGAPEPANAYYSSYLDTTNGLDNDPHLLAGYLLTDFIAPGKTTPLGSFTFGAVSASDVGLLGVNGDGLYAQFSSSATPLPSTWTMLIAGFVGLGFLAFRGTKRGSAALAAA